jgi:two-component system sensor histidine kinase RpfC
VAPVLLRGQWARVTVARRFEAVGDGREDALGAVRAMADRPNAATPTAEARLGDSQEFQAALVRFGIGGVALVFLVTGHLVGSFAIPWGIAAVLFVVHLVVFLSLFAWVIASPRYCQPRSDLAVLFDLTAITSLIYVVGDPGATPMFLLYIVLFLSQGTRFGERNLVIAALGSVICYAGVATVMGAWTTDPVQTGFVLLALAILPLYQQSLLRRLQRAWRNAEAAKEARGEFLRTMTHELRTPLSGVIGMTRVLERTPLDDEQRRYVASIGSSASTLQALVGDMIDLSKVDAGTLELNDEWFDLRDTVTQVCHNLGPQALAKGVELICRIDDDVPQRVQGDPVRVQQIVYNLVGNAVKFTEQGRIWVHLERLDGASQAEHGYLRLAIGDTGIGIPSDRVGYVFDSYWQADTAMVGRYGGSGLGTAIAYRLARAMGGDIEVDSREGEGTVFRVDLPLLSGRPDVDASPQPPPALAGRRVVIVEGDAYARDAISSSCRRAGMGVDEYARCDAVSAQAMRDADVVVLADAPAGEDMRECVRNIRDTAGRRVPIVYIGYRGRPLPAEVEADAAVTKPFQPRELWQGLSSALAGIADGAAETPGPRSARRKGYRVLVAEDDAVNADLIQTLLDRTGFDARVVRDGEVALQALTAEAFDVALLDLRMPGMDGAEIARRVRARSRQVALVALSADPGEATRAACMAAGMDAFLSKPVEPDRLEDLLQRLVPA